MHKWIEPNIYSAARNWSWNEKEEQAKLKFETIRNAAIDSLPQGFYQEKVLSHLNFMKKNPLYPLLKTLPKGALHHDHFDCNEDPEFVRIYLFSTGCISSLIRPYTLTLRVIISALVQPKMQLKVDGSHSHSYNSS